MSNNKKILARRQRLFITFCALSKAKGMAINMRIQKYKKAKRTLDDINRNPSKYLIIHYSCESFYDIKDGRTPRITSIAVRYYDTAQTESFSIHKIAEKQKIPLEQVKDCFDSLEKMMLSEFFKFVKVHKGYKWLHWNMRDINYGFKAIEYRFEVLGGKPEIIQDNDKIDISRIFIDRYGVAYISHPRMESLLKKNHIAPKDYLNGEEEAKAFENKEYIKLHQSTLRKVDVISNILDRACENTLKTNASWKDIYGVTPSGIFEFLKNNWVWNVTVWFITLIIGAVLGKIIN